MNPGSLNLDSLISQQKYQIKINSENFEEPKDAEHRRWKEKWSFIIVMICLVGLLIGLGIYIIFRPESKNEGIALSGAISIVIGIAGYYLKGSN